MSKTFYDYTVKDAADHELPLSQYKGKPVLVVNVASQCGFTPQYEGLEKLYKKYQSQGLVILGFPCNQFGAQEPGDMEEIKNFCKLTYDVTFPIMAKVDVNGDKADPVFSFLKSSQKGILGTEVVKWNFTKFLVDKNGVCVDRFAPNTSPESLEKDILKVL